MSRRPLALALALALLPAAAQADDLLQSYQKARSSDPQYAAAEASRNAAQEGAVQARAAMLPQIDGSAGYSRSDSDSTGVQVFGSVPFPSDSSQESTTRNWGVNVDQMVFDYSRISTLRSQKALGRASDFTLEAAGDSLITRTAAAYFNVLIALETLAAAEAAEIALKKQFDFASKRLEVGLAPITDVHEARAQYDAARANTILTRNALEDAYQALAEITGQPVTDLKALPADFKPEMPAERDADGWVATAIDNNPALKAQEEQLAAAEADVETARAGHYPSLYFNGTYGNRRTNGDNTNNLNDTTIAFENEGKGTTLSLNLRVPIFAGGATQSRVRQALAQRDARAGQLEQQRRAVERSTRNAYQSLLAGISEVEARRLALVAAKSASEASQVGLEVGTRTVLDVLNNQRTLFEAQREYARAKYNSLQARLNLEQAAGTLQVSDVEDVNRMLTTDESVATALGTVQ